MGNQGLACNRYRLLKYPLVAANPSEQSRGRFERRQFNATLSDRCVLVNETVFYFQ